MRFIPSSCLKEGMITGKDIFGKDGVFLLAKDQLISNAIVEKIVELGYQGIYIKDEISADIEVRNIIDDSIRQKAISAVKNMFESLDKNNEKKMEENLETAKRLVKDIIDEIMNSKDLVINMVDLKVFDDYTYYHSVNVAVISMVVGMTMGLTKDDLCKLGLGALLHDIGKVFVPKELLNKEGQLSDEEMQLVRNHAYDGYTYLKEKWDLPVKSCLAVLIHHERYNGTGYPKGKRNDKIHLFGRIIAVADVYDAFTSDRPYRKAVLPSDAVEYIMGASGLLFDPEVVRIFVQKVAPYPLGTCVKLSNGNVGIVIDNYEDVCLRPKIRLLNTDEEVIIDLKNDSDSWNITIIGVEEI